MPDPTHATPPTIDQLPARELEILDFWQREQVFAASLAKPAPKGPFVFFEGPPTANNVPHIGHALTRVMKDLYPRFRTMRGHRVARKAGWDTHGLPVEIAIEKELGFTDKNAIEDYGIEAFNDKCYRSVRRYEREWVAASERLGFWLDYDHGYFTFANPYVESVWWILSRMFEEDMLYEGRKVLPYCPLCGTTHSSHEVAQAYQDVKDPSVTVAFHLEPGQHLAGHDFGERSYILAWTTTPWTLPSNMATCAHPDAAYVLVRSAAHPDRSYLIARDMEQPVEEIQPDNTVVDLRLQPVVAEFVGHQLEGLRYEPLFQFTGADTEAAQDRGPNWQLTVDPYVTLASGTGLVHVAPAFGEDDHRVGLRCGLTLYCAMTAAGRFKDHAGPYAGMWFKDADEPIIGALKGRGQLVRSVKHEHSYPHCWRHDTPLYYFATSSWFVRTTALKERLIAGNQEVQWTPSHIRDGRFGRWLEGVVDWALSRKRYWGTPLPIWRCPDCGRLECMGSYQQLFERAGRPLPEDPYDRGQWNPHRPFVDDITLPCTTCGAEMSRVTEVIDCWFDAGSMPFAQHHYPFDPEGRELVDSGDAFPADFISEAVDQTRGWFYTLHVISTFLKDRPAYKSVIVLGHVLDEKGKKMSKSRGNVVAPDAIIDRFGADAFRWFFYRSGPTTPSRFGPQAVRDSLKPFLIPLLNSWSFFSIYASIDGFDPAAPRPPFAQRAPLDRWVLSELRALVLQLTDDLENNRTDPATQAVESFVDALTNWYIRRSRRRFWKGADDEDKAAAHSTLYEVLCTLAHVLAPFTPFLAERMHQDLIRPSDPEAPVSIHLADWPEGEDMPHDDAVLARMAAARRLVSLGHAARQASGVGVRQPMSAATVVSVDDALLDALGDAETAAIVRDELNVRALRIADDRGAYVSYQVKPNFRSLGRKLGKRMKACAAAVGRLDPASTVALWERDGRLDLELGDGSRVTLEGDDLDVRIQQREGTASAFDDAALVALDTDLDDGLILEGLAREVINRIQGLRKQGDLDYEDRIAVTWSGGETIARALSEHRDLVAGEVLAASFEAGEAPWQVEEQLRGEGFAAAIEVVHR